MFGVGAIWNSFPKITRVIYPKNSPNQTCNYLITGQSQQTNKHFVLKLISFDSGQLQNNTANGAMSNTINPVIKSLIATK